ncbi:MAG: DUF6600 domain-containing protein [Limisphaerales bacterium]
MKTRKWLALNAGGVAAGVTALIAWTSEPEITDITDITDGENQAASALAAGSTNTPGATNAPRNDSQPIVAIPPKIPTSPGIAEIVKLAQAGVEQDVLLAYVENSQIAYNPTADELVYLHDVGIQPRIVTAIMQQGNLLRDQAAKAALAAAASQITQPASLAPLPTPAAESSVPPTAPDAAPAYNPGSPPESPSYNVTAPAVAPVYAAMPEQANHFYDSLAPYGTWYETPDYGWCWQPSVAVIQPAWRPYSDYGRWLDSDCGWYWQSDYSWGWAPFHYGRWCRNDRFGWMWVPGTVWGPSWVSWRRSPQYCGWAPLPPAAIYAGGGGFTYFGASVGVGFGFGLTALDFTFVPFRHFGDRNPASFRLSPVLARNMFHETTVINHYVPGPNNRIINLGVDRRTLAAATRSEIPKVAIRDLTPAPGKLTKPDRLERDGSRLVVYRPQPLNGLPSKPSGQISYNRQELASRTAAASGAAAAPQTRSAAAFIPKNVEPHSPATATMPVANNQFGPGLGRSVTGLTADRSRAVQPQAPSLGRYPTQPSVSRPPGSLYQTRTEAGSLPLPSARPQAGANIRQEPFKPAASGSQFGPRMTSPQTESPVWVRPSFYNPANARVQPAPVQNYRAPDYSSWPAAERVYTPAPALSQRPVYSPPSQPQYATPPARSYQPSRTQPGNVGSVGRSPGYSPPPNPAPVSGPGRRGNTY